jgi:hypothetical protein
METTVNQGMHPRNLSSRTAPAKAAELDPTQIYRTARAGKCSSADLFLLLLMLVFVMKLPLAARDKEKLHYGEGLVVNIPLPESEVEQVVQEVVQNGLIRGTKEYNKDEFVGGAKAATSSRVFPVWEAGGKTFYKVREEAIDPRNFKDSGDIGTLAVRYVVQAQGEKNTVLRIDALFVEDFRRTVHQSNGSVESGEYKDIHQHIEAIEVMREQNVEAEKEREERRAKKQNLATLTGAQTEIQSAPRQSVAEKVESHTTPAPRTSTSESVGSASSSIISSSETSSSQISSRQQSLGETPPNPAPSGATVSGQTLEEHVKDLRKQVERLVRAPGAPLKSAPFHTASTLQPLATGTEILILISTPYWYGVETHEGQHGWLLRDQVEQP